jgi:DEAD/DEAH box helicase domain-containing protein
VAPGGPDARKLCRLIRSRTDDYYEFVEGQVPALLEHIQQLDRVVGFNINDSTTGCFPLYQAGLQPDPNPGHFREGQGPVGIPAVIGPPGVGYAECRQTADGLDALRWWREGKMAKILEYCRSDVAITRDLYLFGLKHRYLLFQNKAKQTVRLPVDW